MTEQQKMLYDTIVAIADVNQDVITKKYLDKLISEFELDYLNARVSALENRVAELEAKIEVYQF